MTSDEQRYQEWQERGRCVERVEREISDGLRPLRVQVNERGWRVVEREDGSIEVYEPPTSNPR